MKNGTNIWNNLLSAAMKLPGSKVDRKAFLIEYLSDYCENDAQMIQIINGSPLDVLSVKQLDKIADQLIKNRRFTVSSLSALAGLPGGFAMVASVPADTAQYLFHCIVISQQLAYLYGFPELKRIKGNNRDMLLQSITVFVGVMFGVSKANEALNTLIRVIADTTAKKILEKPLTQTAWYPIMQAVAKALGYKLSNKGLSNIAKKGIPLLGAAISGGITYYTFNKGADLLRQKLIENIDELRMGIVDEEDYNNESAVKADGERLVEELKDENFEEM